MGRLSVRRWFTSWFLHQSFPHLLSNSLLLGVLGWSEEQQFGCWRIMLLWLFSALGGMRGALQQEGEVPMEVSPSRVPPVSCSSSSLVCPSIRPFAHWPLHCFLHGSSIQ
jgi:membrane associated rhomboid family serine protease